MMPEISLTQDPAHVRHGSNIGQPLTRRDGVLKVKGAARATPPTTIPPGMLMPCSRSAASRAAASASSTSRRPRRHPGVVEVMTSANRPPLARRPGRQDQPLHVPARSAAERPGALRQPADRGGDRRDAGGRDRRRRAAVAALRSAAGPRRARRRRKLRAARRRRRQSRRDAARRCRGRACRRHRSASTRPTRRRPSTTMPWSRTPSSRRGTAIRLSIDTPSQGLAMAQGRLAGLFGISPDKIHIRSPFLGGGFGSQGPDVRAAGARHPGGAAGRQAGQARAAPRADVRPGRPSLGLAPAAAHRRRRRRPADRDRPSRQGRDQQLRRFLRAGRRRLAYALREPRHRHLARGGARSTPARRCSCARPARPPARSRWRARSTRRRGPAAWTRSPSASRTTPRSSRSPASRSPRRRCANATRKAPSASAGPAGRWQPRQMRDEDGPAGRLGHRHRDLPGADVRRPRRARRCASDGTGVMEIGAHDMGQGAWTALAQIAADGARARRSTGWSSGRAPPTCRTPASPAARPTPRPPAWRSTMPARR